MTAAQIPAGTNDFLTGCGWGSAAIEPLTGDASFRRYFRVRKSDGSTAMLMDAPPPHEDPKPFLHVAYANARARGLYEQMGYRLRRDIGFFALRRG